MRGKARDRKPALFLYQHFQEPEQLVGVLDVDRAAARLDAILDPAAHRGVRPVEPAGKVCNAQIPCPQAFFQTILERLRHGQNL